jgi:hypothetical protein
MDLRDGVRITTLACVAALTTARGAESPPPAAPARPTAATAAPSAAPPAASPATRTPRPLDLWLRDLRRHLPAALLQAPAQEAAANDGGGAVVVIEGSKPSAPDADKRPIPQGIIGPFWALAHPLKAWRLLVPDPNAPASGPPDPVPRPRPFGD